MSTMVENLLRGNLERTWKEWARANRERVINLNVREGMDEEKKRKAQELGRKWLDHVNSEMKGAIKKRMHPMAMSLWMMDIMNNLGMELSMGIDGFHLDPGPYDEKTSRSLALAIWACFQYQFPRARA
jgi:hypothetical protein